MEEEPGTARAAYVCLTCKARKGRCNKALPLCAYCSKNGRICEYPGVNSPGRMRHESRPRDLASGERHTPRSEPSQSTQPGTPLPREQSAFPSVLFLDTSIFQQAQIELPKAGVIVPSYVNELIGDTRSADVATSYFFKHIHPWLPIISKRRLYQHFLNPLLQLREDTALLLLSIKLITWWPTANSNSAHTALYLASKRYFTELQTAGIFSVQIVQASVLISLYELGHSIYPAAFLSIGVCARYGAVLELDKDITLHRSDSPIPWQELEERRRLWWAILILDRFINLGGPLRIRATKDPGPEDVLPSDDTVWENSREAPRKVYTASSPSDIEMGRFARFAQATYLLGRVLNHLSDQQGDQALRAAESIQLNRTILALVNLSQCESQIRNLEFCTQISTCYSALLLLQHHHSVQVPEWLVGGQGPTYPVTNPEEVSMNTALMVRSFLPGGTVSPDDVSPFVLHLLYQATLVLSTSSRASASETVSQSLAVLREVLNQAGKRWKAAENYIAILGAQEIMSKA